MTKSSLYNVGNLSIITPVDWLDVTGEIECEKPPFTLARIKGVGVLQFTIADYQSGEVPNITVGDLGNLMADFARSRELGRGHDLVSRQNPLLIRAESFDLGDRFLRVWYCSDGQNIALVTYNCETGAQQTELSDCESIISNLKFAN